MSHEKEYINWKAERVRGFQNLKNAFGVISDSVRKLKNFKLNLFPSPLAELEQGESLEVGSLPPFKTPKSLKSKTPPRPKLLLRLSFPPSEIGSRKKLEEVDLSFNKFKTLTINIADMVSLKSLKDESDKLVELPLCIANLSSLTTIDVSNNRLTSLRSLELFTHEGNHIQHNKLQDSCQIPPWISCNLEGNNTLGKDSIQCEPFSSSTEEELSACICKEEGNHSLEAKSEISLPSSSSKSVASAFCSHLSRGKIGWKRGQRKACRERLDNSRKFWADLKENGQVDGCLKAKNDALPKTRRRHGVFINNSKPSKRRRSLQEFSRVSQKYSKESFCGANDILADGFYDAGQDRSFKLLSSFENETFCLDTREVILVDRERDEELDAITLSAQQVISGWKRFGQGSLENAYKIDDYKRASLFALFVSNCFGGTDKSLNISTMRRAVAGANVGMPFVCTCPINNNSDVTGLSDQAFKSVTVPGIDFLSEQSVRILKEQYNSNVVPIGAIQYGVDRHRAILMKYLCDRADPPIPCELIRGYLDYKLHAWNAIIINKDGKWVRLIVDTCRPQDIREEEDPEYFCRYIPLTRFLFPPPTDKKTIFARNSVWPYLHEEISRGPSGAVVYRCTLGQLTAAAKVRCLEVSSFSKEQLLNFERNFLAEVRMLGALKKHPCIVDLYGHQISSSWVSLSDGMGESQVVQYLMAMEYVNGGSVETLLGKLAQEHKMCITPKLALFIARDVACALSELHSKNIIHRDVKSKNVLIDLEDKRLDGSPVVKLCDFDLAVPLDSSFHTCCLAHHSVGPAELYIGTPVWMAPEVLQTLHKPQRYGMEVDIWSFGCLILELLTLQTPYAGFSDSEIHKCLQMEQRSPFTRELDIYLSESNDKVPAREKGNFPEESKDIIKLLANLFISCTERDPSRRPTAKEAYEILSAVSGPTPMTSNK